MDRAQEIWRASVLGRVLSALCVWCSVQWKRSWVVHAFLTPRREGPEWSQGSVFFRLWTWLRRLMSALYRALRLDKLLAGSIFRQTWLFGILAVGLAPVLPTMAVLALALLGFFSLAIRLAEHQELQLVYSPMNKAVLLYAAVYLASIFTSVTVAGSLKGGMLTVAFVLFAIVLQNAITTRRQLDLLLDLMVLAGAVVALIGVYQYIFKTGYQSAAWVDSDMFSSISFRVASTMQNPNMLGQYFILIIPLGVAGLLSAKDWGRRLFYLFCCGLMGLCIILTLSRGAWLGLLFAAAVFVVLWKPQLILLAPVALVALYFVMPETVVSRFTSIGNLNDSSTSYRVYIWMGALAMLKEYWLCGVGPGDAAFNLVYPAYSYNTIVAPHAHNLFLQIVCDAGICALIIFLVILIQYVRTLCVAMHREKEARSRLMQIAGVAGLAGFMVQAMTDYSFYNYRVMFLFWAFLAVGTLSARRTGLQEGGLLQ